MHPTRPAWTIVEMLVAMAVTAVLLALTVPAAMGVVATGREAACLSAARTYAQTVHVYAADSQGRVPAMKVAYPDEHFAWDNTVPFVRYEQPDGGFGLVMYAAQGWFSARVLSYAGYLSLDDGKCPTQRRITDRQDDSVLPSYSIPEVFYFRTAVYERPDPWPDVTASYRVQRLSDVRYPSEKILVFERRLWHKRDEPTFRTALRRGDTPVYVMTDASVRPGTLPVEPPTVYNAALGYARPSPSITPGGVHGSDF